MNIQILIDALVRQTTVLIAQLATSGGARAPLAHVANQVFLDLARELEAQGVGKKVSADMFGLALRSYQRKVQRLRESQTQRGRSLWEAVLSFLTERKVATRADILRRFHRDDEVLIRGVLHDLTESGLVFRSGSGQNVAYRAATDEDLGALDRGGDGEALDALVWVMVYRHGPITTSTLAHLLSMREERLSASLLRLREQDKVHDELRGDQTVFHCHEFLVPLGAPVGWEAAVLDHFQAMVKTICQRLRRDTSSAQDVVGGSTYTFDVWSGHPLANEVYGLLRDMRQRLGVLRERVEAHNATVGVLEEYDKVVVYAGQCVVRQQDEALDEGLLGWPQELDIAEEDGEDDGDEDLPDDER